MYASKGTIIRSVNMYYMLQEGHIYDKILQGENKMNYIFWKIYCSNYFNLALLALAGSVIVMVLNKLLKNKKIYNKLCCIGIICYAFVVLYGTFFNRTLGTGGHSINLIPFSSLKTAFDGNEEGFRVCYMNSLLFYPFGCLFFCINSNSKYKLLVCAVTGLVLSLIIEALQYLFSCGEAEIDDLICNTLGVCMGYFICFVLSKIIELVTNWFKNKKTE